MTTSDSRPDLRLGLRYRIRRTIPRRGPACEVARVFGLGPGSTDELLYDDFELTLRPGQITAVVGPSGSGKSVLLALACRKLPDVIHLPMAKLAASDSPPVALLDGDLHERLGMLSRCGLAEAMVMITPARLLSGGQLHRLALACALQKALRRGRTAVLAADEFASCLDNTTARNLCRQLRKIVSSSKLSVLLATPRTELLDDLQPDQIIVKPLGQPPRIVERSLYPSPLGEGRVRVNPRTAANPPSCDTLTRHFVPPSPKGEGFSYPSPSKGEGRVRVNPRTAANPPSCDTLTRPSGPPSPKGEGSKQPVALPPAALPPALPPAADWPIQPGSIRDYRQLAAFHYIAGPPAAHKRVYVIRPCESARDLSAPEVAAVLVVSPPFMRVRGRNMATLGRYVPSRMAGRSLRDCVAMLNAEMECISRVIVHPIYRGLGLSVRLVRHALDDGRTPLMEALAVMGRIHPFFAKGGMTGIGLVPGRRLLYSYYIAHTAQARPVIDWLWEKEAGMKNSE